MKNLKYVSYSIAMQEVPNEVSLVINVSDCHYKCNGCHSKYLWEYSGYNLMENIDGLLNQYNGLISCVCFMGGDQNIEELFIILSKIRGRNIKTCLYTGNDDITQVSKLIPVLDYIKIGRYVSELGGLQSIRTNQKMYKVNGTDYIDITSMFRELQ